MQKWLWSGSGCRQVVSFGTINGFGWRGSVSTVAVQTKRKPCPSLQKGYYLQIKWTNMKKGLGFVKCTLYDGSAKFSGSSTSIKYSEEMGDLEV